MKQRGLMDYVGETMQSPLFLGGAALLSGDGFGGAMQGMNAGQKYLMQKRRQGMADRRRAKFEELTGDPSQLPGINPAVANIARAAGPDAGFPMLAGAIPKERNPLDDEYKRAQIGALNRKQEKQQSRRIVKAKDGRQYYADTQELVLPKVKTTQKEDVASQNIGSMLDRLGQITDFATDKNKGTSPYTPHEVESSIGNWQGDDDGLVMNKVARLGGWLETLGSKHAPRDIRARINADAEALAAAVKKVARGAGEGVFAKDDQLALYRQIGDLVESSNVKDYERRLTDLKERINAAYGLSVGPIQEPAAKSNGKPYSQLSDGDLKRELGIVQ